MKLRVYQNEAISGVKQAIEDAVQKMAVVVPTGGGKTVIFGSIVKDYIKNNPGKSAVVVSHLGLLTKQTGDRFEKDWGFSSEVLQADRIPTGKSNCIITTMQSFRDENKVKRWSKNMGSFSGSSSFTNVGLIIIDEAHYVGSQSYDSIMCMFPDAVIIGFTATPFRGNKLMTNMFERVAYTISMGDLIDQGYLVPPKLKLTPFNTADPAELYAGIVEVIKNHPDEKIVVYLKTIADAEECRNIIVDNGFTCSAITSKFKGKNRDLLLEEYRSGNGPQVLTTVDVLTAGFDSPNLSVIIMPYKVGSVTTYLQRVGRGLRINPGKTHCDIYVGGKNPKLDGGFWERITRQMLKQGRNEYDNYLDDLDFLKDELSEEEYEWTVDVVNMAKAVGKKNMNGLFECIINKEFPVDLLNTFIENHPIVPNKKLLKMRLTDKQFDKLDQFGIDGSCLSRGEAMSTIASIIRKEGTYDKRDIVPSGKYKGYFFNEVPTSYWSMLGGKIGGFKYSKSAGKSGGLVDKYNDFKRRNNL